MDVRQEIYLAAAKLALTSGQSVNIKDHTGEIIGTFWSDGSVSVSQRVIKLPSLYPKAV